jgi:hypothetical protein
MMQKQNEKNMEFGWLTETERRKLGREKEHKKKEDSVFLQLLSAAADQNRRTTGDKYSKSFHKRYGFVI